MKNILLILILLSSNICLCKTKKINPRIKEITPNVHNWVGSKNIGSNLKDKIALDTSKTISFSAIGFEIKKYIELDSVKTNFDKTRINSEKKSEKLTIGEIKKYKIKNSVGIGIGSKPLIIARNFNYHTTYEKTPFIKKISVLTVSKTKNSKFNIRLYGKNNNGEPENLIYDENIIGIAKKGKKVTEIDVSELNIKFPENGFFVAIEWLIIPNNKYESNDAKKQNKISYQPAIGTIPTATNENSWTIKQGEWKKSSGNIGLTELLDKKYNLIAVELTLKN
jgi:hypothetical protein